MDPGQVSLTARRAEHDVGPSQGFCHRLQQGSSIADRTRLTKEKIIAKQHRGGAGNVPKGNQSRFGQVHVPAAPAAKAKRTPLARLAPKYSLDNNATAGTHATAQPDGKQGPKK